MSNCFFKADLFSGALFILRTFKGFDLYLAIIILLIIAALFTITGKLVNEKIATLYVGSSCNINS